MLISRSDLRGTTAILALSVGLSACAVKPEPLTDIENTTRVAEVREAVTGQEAPSGPVTLHDAMARALRYNLTTRLREIERQIAENRTDASIWTMLPKILASGGRTWRSNTQASSSRSVTTGQQSLETSTSLDERYDTADLKLSWNILDFGVSYFTARQAANQSLVAEERRKKVVQQLMNDVREAYWKAVAAERLLGHIDATLEKVRAAADKADAIEMARAQKPLDILSYQRDLYSKLLQLQGLRRTLLASKFDLAKMMNLSPDKDFTVAIPDETPELPALKVTVAEIEELALLNRPELLEESYQERVAADEVRKSIARMFPGLELTTTGNYNSNSYLLNNRWGEAGLKLTWNLVNLLSGWDDIELAETQERLALVRRQALGMAVLTQVNLAYLDLGESTDAFRTVARINAINKKIELHKQRESEAQNLGDLEMITTYLNSLLSQMKQEEQYAQLQGSFGRLLLAVGIDPYAGVDDTTDLATLAENLAARDNQRLNGDWFRQLSQSNSKPTS